MTPDGLFARILTPTDFSAGSEKAWSLAQRVAIALNAELVLLHVLPATPIDMEARVSVEERKAAVRALQAEHQLGIPRAEEEEEPSPLRRLYEGPLAGDALREFSVAGREWAAKLEQWASAGRASGCKVRTCLRVGEPYREIIDAAREERADLLLLATHGHGKIHRLLVGSVADRVIRMAPCPVLTIKEA